MALLTNAEIFAHLRISDSPPADADLIAIYRDAALAYIAQYLNTPNYPESDDIKNAALLLIGGAYEHREALTAGETMQRNPAVDNLLHFYRQNIGI